MDEERAMTSGRSAPFALIDPGSTLTVPTRIRSQNVDFTCSLVTR